MISKGTKLYSVIHQKCPRCQEGDMFKYRPYSKGFMAMHENCPSCGFDLKQEPSFYFGAMYFSYAIQVVVFVMVYFAVRFTINPETWTYVIYMILASFIILPLNFRWSRVAWINLFVSFEKIKLDRH